MKKPVRTYLHYLEDILLSINRIQEYLTGYDLIHFKQDYKTVDAVIRNFEIIGEASKNIPPELKERHPQVPWQEMYRLRNRITHEYFGIDHEIIWDIAIHYLPENKQAIINIISRAKTNFS